MPAGSGRMLGKGKRGTGKRNGIGWTEKIKKEYLYTKKPQFVPRFFKLKNHSA